MATPRIAAAAPAPSAVVVGAGIAGLSAAWDLQRAGFRVTVLEKDDMAGGRMVQRRIGPLHTNPHAGGVYEANREMYALADAVGVSLHGDELYDTGFIDNGRGIYEIALRFHLAEVMNIPGLGPDTRRRLPVLAEDLAMFRAEVDPCLLASGAAYDDESLWDYYARRLGEAAAREVVDYWVDPVLDAWGFRPEENSRVPMLAWFAQQQARLVVPRDDIGVLTRKLATLVEVRLMTPVSRISAADASGRHTVHYLGPDHRRQSLTPDVVVCAVEGKYAGLMVEGLTARQREFLRSIFFTQWAGVSYVLKPQHAPAAPAGGRYIPAHPDPVKRRLYGWLAQPAAPEDYDRPPLVSVWLARREVPRWTASGEPLPRYCLPLIQQVYPVLRDDMIDDVVVQGGDDLVQLPTGFIRAMAGFLRDQEKEKRGLYFAGEYLGHAHTGGACASGRSVARTIIRHWT
jgi:oxygen-dependent protoporphyrinogen oxidase